MIQRSSDQTTSTILKIKQNKKCMKKVSHLMNKKKHVSLDATHPAATNDFDVIWSLAQKEIQFLVLKKFGAFSMHNLTHFLLT